MRGKPYLYLDRHGDLPVIHPAQLGIKVPESNRLGIIGQHLIKRAAMINRIGTE